jgi:hypothetical protein
MVQTAGRNEVEQVADDFMTCHIELLARTNLSDQEYFEAGSNGAIKAIRTHVSAPHCRMQNLQKP